MLSRTIAMAALLLAASVIRLEAAQTLVSGQNVTCVANDVVCTFPNQTTPGNAVIALAWTASTDTITINNSTFAFTATLNSPFAPGNQTARMYIWCGIADPDESYTFTTSGKQFGGRQDGRVHGYKLPH